MNKIYFYKMTTDNGGAPCVSENLLSLAICKPKVRSTCSKDDYIIGFGGKDYKGRLIYIARITDKLENGKYYKDKAYSKRPDCIYQYDHNSKPSIKQNAKYHYKGEHMKTDLSNANVLLSMDNFTYFGIEGTEEYKKQYPHINKAVASLTQGHRVNHEKELMRELKQLIQNLLLPTKKHGKPTDADNSKSCSDDEGSIESKC